MYLLQICSRTLYAIVERRIKDMDAYKVMQDVKNRFELKQKATICLGLIAQFGPVSGSQLVKMLELSGGWKARKDCKDRITGM